MSYTMYTPLNVWLDPASVTDVVAYIQTYLSDNPIYSTAEIEDLINDYLVAHPELIGVQSVNGKTGTVVLSASDINTENDITIESALAALSSQISTIASNVATNTTNITNLSGRVSTAETDISNLKSALDYVRENEYQPVSYTLQNGGINGSGSEFGETAGTYMRFAAYIPTTDGTTIVPNHTQTSNEYLYVCYYNENKVFQVREEFETGDTINTSYAFFRLSYYLRYGNNEATYRSWITWNYPNAIVDKFAQIDASVPILTRRFNGLSFCNIMQPFSYNTNVSALKNKIDLWNEYGFDGYIVCLNADWNGTTLSLREDLSALSEAFSYIRSCGKTIRAFKLHCTTYDTSEAFRTAYYDLCSSLCTTIKSYGCYRFIVLNECTLCLDSTYATWIVSLLDMIGEEGMGRSISFNAELFGYGKVPSSVLNAMSWLCFNIYPSVGNKGKGTLEYDYKTAWDSSFALPYISTYKYLYPGKEIWITESGCGDYYINLAAPAKYDMDTSTAEASNGITQATYLKYGMETLNGNVTAFCPWYSIDSDAVRSMFRKELGVM